MVSSESIIENKIFDNYKFCIGWRWSIKNPNELLVCYDSPVPQNEEQPTYNLWCDEEDYLIGWRASSEWISRFCESVGYPYKGVKTYSNGKCFRILEANPVADVRLEGRERDIGKVIFKRNTNPIVVCGAGLLKIQSLRDDKDADVAKSIPFRSKLERAA